MYVKGTKFFKEEKIRSLSMFVSNQNIRSIISYEIKSLIKIVYVLIINGEIFA